MNRRFTPLALVAAIAVASSAYADVDPCLVGSWDADLTDMAHIMGLAMQGSVEISGGSVVWDIPPGGAFRLTVIDLTLVATMEGAPPVPVTINGYSAGQINTTDGAFDAVVSDFNLVGQADIMGSVMEIPFTDEMGLFGSGTGIYGCTETGLSLEEAGQPGFPRNWTR